MSSRFDFSGHEKESVTFATRLDGDSYQCRVKWNHAAQRWYLMVRDQGDAMVLNIALAESAYDRPINLLAGVFKTSTLVWYARDGVIEVQP